jgi:MobA-like NTP transferase domain
MAQQAPKNVVLLAAGRGSRMSPLTDRCHKSLLPIGGKPALQLILDEVLTAGAKDVVIVVGHRRADIEAFVQGRYGDAVRCVANDRYEEDVNILSVQIGVNALRQPDDGYLIVETDLVMEPRGWRTVLCIEDLGTSFWVTRGRYSQALTGGALYADEQGGVVQLVYRPRYDPACEGWSKLLGILYVGSDAVGQDILLRQRAIGRSIAQYYMMPWVEHPTDLPCRARDLQDVYAVSYNDEAAYRRADEEYARILSHEGRAMGIEMVDVASLKHIEGFSKKRVQWLKDKIVREGVWNKPVALDVSHGLVLDGQHRMEVAKALGLKRIPAIKYDYSAVKVWSLRPGKHEFTWETVVERALAGDIYPYKTVKHEFPVPLPACHFNIEELMA